MSSRISRAAASSFGNDRLGIVHTVIGKKRFTDEELKENLLAFVDVLNRAKPTGVKGVYLKSIALPYDGPRHSPRYRQDRCRSRGNRSLERSGPNELAESID